MLQSNLFTKTLKEAPKDEQAISAQLLQRAGFVDKLMAGVYSFLPLGLRVLKKIENIIREEMNGAGGQEILLPVLHPKELWQKTGRWQDFDALYKLKGRDGKEMALGPTHEEVVVNLAKNFIDSYKDLPIYLYQIQTKFRDEFRVKSGLLRNREFLMKDLYSFHSSQEDLDKFYENMKKVYQKLFKRCGLESLIVEASGGTFSKYSHEFQVLNDFGEDTIFHCSCGFSRNKEIADFKEGDSCPECGKKIKLSQSIEVGNIFKLGTKYSEPFDLSYRDEKGEKKLVIMGCYGIGLGRVMGAIAEIHHDENGVIWPESVAPFDIHMISILPKDAKSRDKVEETAKKLYDTLSEKKKDDSRYEVLYDNRTDVSAGEKLVEADLLGIPWRIVISEKTVASGKIEIKRRGQKTAKLIKPSEVYKIIKF